MSAISEDDVRALRQQNDLKAFMVQEIRAGHARNATRRAAVLAHPELAVKLTQDPLNFSTPEKWAGYIPPALTCTGALNTTPRRPALLALVAEAERRARQPKGIAA